MAVKDWAKAEIILSTNASWPERNKNIFDVIIFYYFCVAPNMELVHCIIYLKTSILKLSNIKSQIKGQIVLVELALQ